MNHASAVRGFKRLGNLPGHRQRFLQRQRTLLKAIRQDRAGMIEGRHRASFLVWIQIYRIQQHKRGV